MSFTMNIQLPKMKLIRSNGEIHTAQVVAVDSITEIVKVVQRDGVGSQVPIVIELKKAKIGDRYLYMRADLPDPNTAGWNYFVPESRLIPKLPMHIAATPEEVSDEYWPAVVIQLCYTTKRAEYALSRLITEMSEFIYANAFPTVGKLPLTGEDPLTKELLRLRERLLDRKEAEFNQVTLQDVLNRFS